MVYETTLVPPGGTQPAKAASLVAAFNGGFKMNEARGGYYTERRTVYPLRPGAASLVIYANGQVSVGACRGRVGRDFVTMSARPGG